MARTDLFDLLTGKTVDDITQTQLNQALDASYADRESIQYWQSAIIIAKALETSRTAPHGLPIPETGSVATTSIANGATGTIQPTSANEVWLVQSLGVPGALDWVLNDGTSTVAVPTNDQGHVLSPFYITKSLYLTAANGSGGTVVAAVGYVKVAM